MIGNRPFKYRAGYLGLAVAGVFVLPWLASAQQIKDLKIDISSTIEDLKNDKGSKDAMPVMSLEDSLKKAKVNNKYEMLLRQIKVPKDMEVYKEFNDFGFRNVTEYAGHADLPKGHWVYVYPYWYIWRDLTATPKAKRAWGPEQATGPPDTDEAGDIQTAWASLTPDNQDEWLICEYAEPVVPNSVLIYETYNPGAVNKVSVFKLDGTEVEVWKGMDPTPPDSGKGVSVIPIKVDFKVNRIKIYIASTQVPGWNEIDAVGLREKGDKTQWAMSVEASSTYAQQEAMIIATLGGQELNQRMMRLEAEVRELKASLEEMKKMKATVEELRDLLKKQK
jgi:hypothetical protein